MPRVGKVLQNLFFCTFPAIVFGYTALISLPWVLLGVCPLFLEERWQPWCDIEEIITCALIKTRSDI